MKLTDLVATLRNASQPLDLSGLYEIGRRISTRASMLAMGDSSFVVQRTATGIRITATNPTERAKRALARALQENQAAAHTTVAQQGRDRLVS